MLGLPREARQGHFSIHLLGSTWTVQSICTVVSYLEKFPGLKGLFSPYPYYPQIQFILLNLAVNGPVKKNFKCILTSLTIALKSPFGKAILAIKIHPTIAKLLNVDTRLSSLDATMRESTLWGGFRENTAQQRLQITAVVWETKVESAICISLSLLRDTIYTRCCCSWTRWMEAQVTRHNSKADNL